ncbi:HlyD family secretion protein [Alteromonas sp. a30]|uniref:HlyD family secretion protein n=1 Tax=Alteromonas sp. a30 TaxID=2730917 RepID=UPI002283276F|nr:HlyD family efflux transporter periplasmic adaptor subunit [Alteromonas sp. a30]MCY7295502.1 HlyD family efflux transporter periplasmic adaptor subunit [Alteromonas sp. a30]
MDYRIIVRLVAVLLAAVLAFLGWRIFEQESLPHYVIQSNGRIEAVEIDIAAKNSGRLESLLVSEGEFVDTDQVVALMDIRSLEAELSQAKAQLKQAETAVITAESQLSLRRSEKASALAIVAQRETELNGAKNKANRLIKLAKSGFTSEQSIDDAKDSVKSAKAALTAAQAQAESAEAAISTALTQIDSAKSSVIAAQAAIQKIQLEIDDGHLKTHASGRVQYIVARPGEVVAGGGRILNIVDLTDVYMNFFLPAGYAGQLAMGDEVRLILNAAPDYVIPASISFIADVAQFTPKTVETENEREKLMFRVRARISPELLQKYIQKVKTGLPGAVYIKVDAAQPWPESLQHNLLN